MGGYLQEGGSGLGKPRPLSGGIEICKPGAVNRQDGFMIKYACMCSFIHSVNSSFLVPRQFL